MLCCIPSCIYFRQSSEANSDWAYLVMVEGPKGAVDN
jgi:hypothetical protein